MAQNFVVMTVKGVKFGGRGARGGAGASLWLSLVETKDPWNWKENLMHRQKNNLFEKSV